MKVKLIQKVADIDGKNVAFVETQLCDENGRTYTARFDDKTKKRFNAFAKANGFIIGVVADGSSVSLPHEKEF